MKKLLLSAFVILFNLFFAITVFGQGKLIGVVKDKSGNPISFSTVILNKSSLGAISGIDGTYKIEGIPAGTYTAKASIVGYTAVTKDVTISENQNATADFILESSNTLNEVVVTGVVNPRSALESSVSISTLKTNQITEAAAVSTSEILRSIPGVRSEASGGDGNTNITVRGVPIATGGSKYLQLYEDGLPVLQFGDIAFATADIFLRIDNTVSRIEAIRGGSASTTASNSPAGIINFISKTGSIEGGSIATSVGLDHRMFRTDFEYGSPIGNNMTFHIGGFYRNGDGPRTTNFTSNNGGQIKANLTKYFNKGYARVYLKFLNDRTPAYMPMPMSVSGTNASPTWGSVEGYNAIHGAMQSPYLLSNIGTGPDGSVRRSNVADGMHPVSTAVGSEMAFELGNGWNLMNRARVAFNSGGFIAPFPAQVGTVNDIATGIAGAGYHASYALTGDALGSNINGNDLLMRMHLFDTQLNDLNNFTNDFNLSKTIGKAKITGGLYKAYQNISMSWLWNSYLTDVTDKGSQLVNLTNAAGDTSFTDNGLLAYGVPAWGNCCHRNYDTHYDITAPYAGVEVQLIDKLTAEGSVRFDIGNVSGSYSGGNGQTKAMDIDGDGIVSYVESNVATVNNSKPHPVNYNYNYTSYSIGVNYSLNNSSAVFARYSKGGRANADRLLFGPYILANGKAAAGLSSDMVGQAELGYKLRSKNILFNATGFMATTEEQNYEATTQKSVNRTYEATGVELDGDVIIKKFDIRAGVTFTQAKIKKDVLSPLLVGNKSRRQAAVIFNLTPTYRTDKYAIGLTIIGTTSSYTQDDNKLVMPGYAYVNGFVTFDITKNLLLGVSGNNLFDQIGVTESEEGSIKEGTTNVVRARSIAGRSASVSLKFNF